ncbi:uncharacterized protein LOC121735299 [Aricia agestis]|uniref:uncharacterized protein LOC121735299 n=1 Tax=Aricia agestis TaxID=91739 RepID=UPI001C20983D|nr:uncharacterized protein LOC121735299 [Aricia agestis]
MADAATVRREARRRKILANSQNRLQLISGKNCDDLPKDTLPTVEANLLRDNQADKNISNEFNCLVGNGSITPEPFSFDAPLMEGDNEVDGNQVNNDLAAFASQRVEPNQTESFREKFSAYRYDVVVLSVVIQILHSYAILTPNKTYFFLPLVLHVITKFIWYPKPNNFNFANALLLLNGISASRAQRIMKVTHYISELCQDACVFLFSTVCINAVCLYMEQIVN